MRSISRNHARAQYIKLIPKEREGKKKKKEKRGHFSPVYIAYSLYIFHDVGDI